MPTFEEQSYLVIIQFPIDLHYDALRCVLIQPNLHSLAIQNSGRHSRSH